MPRGVETAARGGASVAGVRNPHALWYNPAGLTESKRQLLVDAVVPMVQTEFSRRLDNGSMAPTVEANSAVPIPTLAYSDDFGVKDWNFGIALMVPPGYLAAWPDEVNGERAPQRYSVLDANGSFIGTLALGAAYRASDRLSVGGALYITAAQVGGTVALSACDYAFCSQPEAPEWEGRTRFLLGPVYTATAALGVTYNLDYVRLGASVQLRTRIAGQAKFDVALPDQAIFDDVTLESADGSEHLKADVSVVLPSIFRVGAEFTPTDRMRIELAGTWERWSLQRSVQVTPIGVFARNVPSVGDVEAQPVTLARNMRDTFAVHLGGSYDLTHLLKKRRKLTALYGAMYETGAFADRDLSPTTIDTQKFMLSAGVSVEVSSRVFVDATYGHLFMQNRNVRDSRVLLPAALKPLPTDDDPSQYEVGDRPAIGNGRYVMEANFVGVGVRWLLDERPPRRQPEVAPAPVGPVETSAPAEEPSQGEAPPAAEIEPPLEGEPAPTDPAPEVGTSTEEGGAPAPGVEAPADAVAPAEPQVAPAETAPPAQPEPAEPAPTEPAPVEPAPIEPVPAEPAPAEQAPAEPAPQPAEQAPAEEPAPAEPVPAERTPAEQAPVEPAPEPAEQAPAEEPAPAEGVPTPSAEPAPTAPAPMPPL